MRARCRRRFCDGGDACNYIDMFVCVAPRSRHHVRERVEAQSQWLRATGRPEDGHVRAVRKVPDDRLRATAGDYDINAKSESTLHPSSNIITRSFTSTTLPSAD